MATKKNKLNPSVLKNAHDKAFTKRKLTFNIEGKTYTCLVDEKFETTKIKEMVFDLIQSYQNFIDMKDVWSLPLFSNFLLLKHFTDLDLDDLTYEQSIMTIKYLDDFECLETIMNAFDENEVAKFNVYMKKATANVKKLTSDKDAMKEIEGMFADLKDEEIDLEEVKIETEGVETSESEEITND